MATAAKQTNSSKEKTMATKLDVAELSYAELLAQKAAIESQLQSKRDNELKVLAEGTKLKFEAAGFTLLEAIGELQSLLPTTVKKTRAPRGSVVKAEKPFVKGVTYVDPKGEGKDWVAGKLGAKPQWLQEIMKGLSDEEAKAKYAELAKK